MKIDPKEFDSIARIVFKPIYPMIARQILAYTGISQGICMDIGCGGGYLGLALARLSGLRVHFVDPLEEMLEMVRRNVYGERLEDRTETWQGSAESIPLPDDVIDLAVSRGSVFFWDNLEKAFQEIHRVLAPGGMAYIGGGFGSAQLKREVIRKWEVKNGDSVQWRENIRRNIGPDAPKKYEAALKRAGIPLNEIIHNQEVGLWITILKAK
jgi:ubiquinone/menaquinone biosynthesis C-methylase UbiE